MKFQEFENMVFVYYLKIPRSDFEEKKGEHA